MEKVEYKARHFKNAEELEKWLNEFDCQFDVIAYAVEGGNEYQDGWFWIVLKVFINKPKI